jgi:hypothetical protein
MGFFINAVQLYTVSKMILYYFFNSAENQEALQSSNIS